MFISGKLKFMFRAMETLLEYNPHSDQNGCIGVTYNFIPHKSTEFGNFLDFQPLYIYF